ncbi:hypothetical protein LCGC14_0687270 [marine sediment metagenome]|uniref:Major tropism determinant N-terminal domain-containing protein n=1 Tax=marine sediment metagenome TaxID=412755 RepID=A0A0F9QLF8_9ZZZZ
MTQLNGKQVLSRSILPDKLKNLPWKEAVVAASTGNLDLSSMPATVDGATIDAGDRFLAKDQTDTTQNGIYVSAGSGEAAVRATDAATTAELNRAAVGVVEGTTNTGTVWEQTTANPTVDASAIVWDLFGTDLEAGEGIEFVGKEITVLAGDGSVEVDAAGVKAAVPYIYDKELIPAATAADTDYEATGIAIDRTPAGDSYVEVNVNGVQQHLADSDRDAGDCYFSDDAGASAKAVADIAAGDALFWNGAVAKFKLDVTDAIDLNYNVVQATDSSSSLV